MFYLLLGCMMRQMSASDRIYLDNASATPIDPRVAKAIYHALEELPGNPSASSYEGRKAYQALTLSRERIARVFSVKADELLFVSGGTEANNIAIQGFIEALHQRGASYADLHIVSTSIEHSSVLETLAILEARGVAVTYVSPDFDGLVRAEAIISALRKETALVTIAHVNSEVGTIQPLSDIHTELKRWKTRKLTTLTSFAPETSFPVFHIDAAQSPLYLDAGPHVFGADMVSYDAQKVQGPKGVGVLYRNFSIPLVPLWGGGTQERSIRPGTENVAGIVGASIAFELAKEGREIREKRVRELRDYMISLVREKIPEAELLGHPKRRIANNALFTVEGADGDYLAILMDERGVAVSPRSACVGTGTSVSHVALELTHEESKARGTIRFSLGVSTNQFEVERAVRIFKEVVAIAKSGLSLKK